MKSAIFPSAPFWRRAMISRASSVWKSHAEEWPRRETSPETSAVEPLDTEISRSLKERRAEVSIWRARMISRRDESPSFRMRSILASGATMRQFGAMRLARVAAFRWETSKVSSPDFPIADSTERNTFRICLSSRCWKRMPMTTAIVKSDKTAIRNHFICG